MTHEEITNRLGILTELLRTLDGNANLSFDERKEIVGLTFQNLRNLLYSHMVA